MTNQSDDYLHSSSSQLSPSVSSSSSFSSASDLESPGLYIGTTRFTPNPVIKTILVTGGLGFIASWLVRHLVFQYPIYRVVCIDNQSYCASKNNIRSCLNQPNFVFVDVDITDTKKLFDVIDHFDVDTIIHMAAESHVDNSFENSLKFTCTNVLGTQNLLEAAKMTILMNKSCDTENGPNFPFKKGKKPITRFLHMSTDEVYGEASQELSESAPLLPTNPYSASKASGDMFVHAYYKSYKVPVVSVRCNNVYGPMQYPEKIIPKFIRLLQNDQICTLHGSGTNTRRYLYVSDAVNALDTVLHQGEIGKIYNIGTDFVLSNIQVAQRLVKLLKDTEPEDRHHNNNLTKNTQSDFNYKKYVKFIKDRPFNDSSYSIDSSLIHNTLGWKPKINLDRGLEMTVKWYNENSNKWWK